MTNIQFDRYPLNTTYYNSLQELNLQKARLKIPFTHTGECLHGVGSFKQSIFPQSLGLSASFDTSLIYRVGRAIGAEARSIGVHACLSPVLDIGQDARWGRMQGEVILIANFTYGLILTQYRGLGRGQDLDVAYGSRICLGLVKERFMGRSRCRSTCIEGAIRT